MATINPVGPETPVTVKVALAGEYRRFKIPLKDLVPNLLANKLRTLLHIQEDQSLLLERFSDSAASYVTLDPLNPAVWKQLYRAAKAKLKLRIRATVTDSLQPALIPPASPAPTLPATVFNEEPAEPVAPSVPLVTKPTSPAAAGPDAKSIPVSHQALQELENRHPPEGFVENKDPEAAEPPKQPLPGPGPQDHPQSLPILTKSTATGPALGPTASQETLVAGKKGPPLYCLAGAPLHVGLTQFSVCCNVCSADIPRVHWHCSICQDGDYDLCANCVDLGHHCEIDSHFLIKRIIENGKVINATLETISKKFGSSADAEKAREGDPVAADEPKATPSMHPSRTCNSCVGVFEETRLVTCTTCEDYDLCMPCLVSSRHGHHPGHRLVPVNQKSNLLSPRALELCPAGRHQFHQAICDGCNQNIRGVRHKCFDCPDYDLCADCHKHAANVHPGHRFAPLYDTIALPRSAALEHPGVSCDGPLCQDKPDGTYIRGVRYKCAVCHDTDFCASCEALPTSIHNRTHPLIKFRTPVAHVSVTTLDELADGHALGDRQPQTSSKATETTAPVNAATQVQTVAEFKPPERAKDAVKIESQRASPAPQLDGQYVSDTITDGSRMPAKQVFCQTWTLHNPGPAPWPKGCCLRFVGGDRMLNMDVENPASTDELDRAISSNTLDHEVPIGGMAQFSVVLKSPVRPGRAISYWRLKTPEGLAFGHKLWCEIEVFPAASSEPPSPTVDRSDARVAPEVACLANLVVEKSEEISRLTQAMADLQRALAGAQADKAAALGDVHRKMQAQRTELLAKLEEVKAEGDRIRASQMIFPKLEKESPEASVYETARQEPIAPAAEKADPPHKVESLAEDELVEDLESVDVDDESTDDGFLTDEEYEILEHEFAEVLSESK